MSKTLDFSGIDNIASVERIDDMGGTFFDFKFTNGKRLRFAPENDVLVFFPNGENEENWTTFFCEMGSGHHEPGAPCDTHTSGQ